MEKLESVAWKHVADFVSNLHNSDKIIDDWNNLKEVEMEKSKYVPELKEEIYALNYELQQLSDEEFELFFTDVCENDEAYSAYKDLINYELARREKLHE